MQDGGGERQDSALETTAILLAKARAGDDVAKNRLLKRFLPTLTRWAHKRLPYHARDLSETGDLVQRTLIKALSGLEHFEYRHEGSFLAWLRQILVNELRDEIRRAGRRPWSVEISPDLESAARNPLGDLLTHETFAVYEAALMKLRPRTREAVILRLEFGYTYAQVADAVGSASENAARMLVSRGVVQLAKELSAELG